MPLIGGSFTAMNGQSYFGFTRKTVVFLHILCLEQQQVVLELTLFFPTLLPQYRLQLSTVNTVDLCRYSCSLTVWSASEAGAKISMTLSTN